MSRKKDAHTQMCMNSTERNKNMYENKKNEAKKPVSIAVKREAEEVLTELKKCPNGMFMLGKGLKIEGMKA